MPGKGDERTLPTLVQRAWHIGDLFAGVVRQIRDLSRRRRDSQRHRDANHNRRHRQHSQRDKRKRHLVYVAQWRCQSGEGRGKLPPMGERPKIM